MCYNILELRLQYKCPRAAILASTVIRPRCIQKYAKELLQAVPSLSKVKKKSSAVNLCAQTPVLPPYDTYHPIDLTDVAIRASGHWPGTGICDNLIATLA